VPAIGIAGIGVSIIGSLENNFYYFGKFPVHPAVLAGAAQQIGFQQ
jgi:hypothetical protein